MTWRNAVSGNGKCTEHCWVLEELHGSGQSWKETGGELCTWRSPPCIQKLCKVKDCFTWLSVFCILQTTQLSKSAAFNAVWLPRAKIFEPSGISRVSKSPGLNLFLMCWATLAPSIFQSPTKCHPGYDVKPALLTQQLKPFYIFSLQWAGSKRLAFLLLNVSSKSSLLSHLSSLVIISWLPMEKGKGVCLLCNESFNFIWQVGSMLRFSFNLAGEWPVWLMDLRGSWENVKNRGCRALTSCWGHLVSVARVKCNWKREARREDWRTLPVPALCQRVPLAHQWWSWGGCLRWTSDPKKCLVLLGWVPAQQSIRAIKPLDVAMGCVWAARADPKCLCLSPCWSPLAPCCWLLSCQKSWLLPPALPAGRGKKSPCLGHHCGCLIPIELFLDVESVGSIGLLTLLPGESSP